MLAESVNQQYETVRYGVNNYWKGRWIKHPAHCNLHGLPTDLVVKILGDFIKAQQNGEAKIRNYQDWLFASYGEEFARTFPMEYTKKFHTTTADNTTQFGGNGQTGIILVDAVEYVPEPTTTALLGAGSLVFLAMRRRKA